jgi:hypothetical protein
VASVLERFFAQNLGKLSTRQLSENIRFSVFPLVCARHVGCCLKSNHPNLEFRLAVGFEGRACEKSFRIGPRWA